MIGRSGIRDQGLGIDVAPDFRSRREFFPTEPPVFRRLD
jgi:hypothetical protein